jgi:hypothetical protein
VRRWLVERGPWSLIVFDPLSRFAGPDAEIDNAAATRFVQALESIAGETGATLLASHHTNKTARKGGAVEAVAGRGSSALVDGVRWQCSLAAELLKVEDPDVRERLGELVTWNHTKSNYSRKAEPVILRRDHESGGALVPLDATDLEMVQDARIVAPARSAAASRAVAADVTVEQDALKLLAVIQGAPGIGSRQLRAKSCMGPTTIERGLERLLATSRITNRPDVHGQRVDPHYFAAGGSAP